jgi:hypothetical protein
MFDIFSEPIKLKPFEPVEHDIDGIVASIKERHFKGFLFDSKVLEKINLCIKDALTVGGQMVHNPLNATPLQRMMAVDAKNFEATLPADADKNHIRCETLPWGWRYRDENIQRQFRVFCNKDKG